MALKPHYRTAARAALLLSLSVLLGGCGFQLRGAPPVSSALQPLSVACDNSVPFELCEAVKTQLDQGDIQTAEPENAAYQLQLGRFSETRRASAIQLDASAAEYDLRQSLRVNVVSDDAVPVVANAEVRTSEFYSYDDTNVLAKRREEDEIRNTLYQRLAQQVLFRMAPLTPERLEAIRAEYREAQSEAEKAAPETP
ncbi:LPS-assembly lipoprotein LptE [Marinobacter bohaiensis]|uniref:LPS-assembly lipoprotein LptE n=1 Tax=Marinobacter bohaiensis TaxID=2201898 RepID=UPI000DAC0280|nr:LPS assembly lipoprotein LptE [Marinobacter bohaiensis]